MKVETNPGDLSGDKDSVLGSENTDEKRRTVASKKSQRASLKNDFDTFDANTATKKQKGNFGEYNAEDNLVNNQSLKDAGYDLKPIGRHAPTSLNDKIVKGIDGIYINQNPNSPIKYIIDEAKFGTSALSTTRKNIKQMSDPWILGNGDKNSRILKAIAADIHDIQPEEFVLAAKIETALNKNQVERVLSKISEDGTVTTYKLNEEGEIVGTWP